MERTVIVPTVADNAATAKTIRDEGIHIHLARPIIEILAFLLEKTIRHKESLVLNVMVRSTTQTLDGLTWFYIKVMTSHEVKMEDFTGQRFSSLYELLSRMQSNDVESYICLQQPRADGKPGSLQENLILEDNRLSTQEVQHKSKKSEFYSIYLRVQLELWQMSKACAELHNYMLLSRIFRPKDKLRFCTNFGEVVTETDFRCKMSQEVSTTLPEIVIDSKFYAKKMDSSSCRFLRVAPNVSTATVYGHIQKPSYIDLETVDIDLVGLCFQYAEDGVTGGKESSVTITTYRPGYAPYPCYSSEVEKMVKNIDWGQYGMKFIADVKPSPSCKDCRWNDSEIGRLLENSIDNVKQKLGELIEQILQPHLSKAKTRSMLNRSIKSVCKGVTDIITMSSGDDFRTKAMEMMRASDTLDIGNKLESVLKSISSRKHCGMFFGKIVPYNTACEDKYDTADNQDLAESQDQIVPVVRNASVLYEDLEPLTEAEEPVEICNTDPELTQTEGDVGSTSTGNQAARQCDIDDLNLDNVENVGKYVSQMNQNDMVVSPFYELEDRQEDDKTPEIAQLTECLKEVSPFQELAVEEALDEDPCVQYNTGIGTCTGAVNKLTDDDILSGNIETHLPISPDYEQIKRYREETIEDKTPEITELSNLFKEVSPFQELAAKDEYIQEEMLYENPIKEVIDDVKFMNKPCTIIRQNLHAAEDELVIRNDANQFNARSSNISSCLHHCDNLTAMSNPCGTLFEETSLKQTEHQVDCLEEDSDDWFNDVLMEVDHWLK